MLLPHIHKVEAHSPKHPSQLWLAEFSEDFLSENKDGGLRETEAKDAWRCLAEIAHKVTGLSSLT